MKRGLPRLRIIIPTCNAGPWARAQIAGLVLAGVAPEQVLVVDSSSSDGSPALYADWGAEVRQIPRAEFRHGGTRQLAAEWSADCELLVYLTQDAIPAKARSISSLLAAFEDRKVGLAYGRQLPRYGAAAIEAHARLYNYPAVSSRVTLADADRLGSKIAFCSNSFAAYRRVALEAVGGFPQDALFAEDQIVAARMLQAGWAKAYVAEAEVLHSHGYTMAEEFRRYFDVGVFHAHNAWLTEAFGAAEGEGARFVMSEVKYLLAQAPQLLAPALLRTLTKYAGYRLGRLERRIPPALKRKLSDSPHTWP